MLDTLENGRIRAAIIEHENIFIKVGVVSLYA